MIRIPENAGYVEARLTLRSSAEGGWQRLVRLGYMGSSDRLLASATAELMDRDEFAPGDEGMIRLHSFAPEIWTSVDVGAELAMTEGPRRVIGQAVVTRTVPVAVAAGGAARRSRSGI